MTFVDQGGPEPFVGVPQPHACVQFHPDGKVYCTPSMGGYSFAPLRQPGAAALPATATYWPCKLGLWRTFLDWSPCGHYCALSWAKDEENTSLGIYAYKHGEVPRLLQRLRYATRPVGVLWEQDPQACRLVVAVPQDLAHSGLAQQQMRVRVDVYALV